MLKVNDRVVFLFEGKNYNYTFEGVIRDINEQTKPKQFLVEKLDTIFLQFG